MLKRINEWIVKTYVSKSTGVRYNVKSLVGNERGAGTVEYGLLIAVIVVLVIGAAMVIDTPLRSFFTDVIAKVRGLF